MQLQTCVCKWRGDGVATSLYHEDAPTNHVSSEVYSDGHCLFQAASVSAFDHEVTHSHVRKRVASELLNNVHLICFWRGRSRRCVRAIQPYLQLPCCLRYSMTKLTIVISAG